MRRSILLLLITLAGCATTGSGGGVVSIETVSKGQPVSGASCAVTNNAGSWNILTPGTVAVGAANGTLRILCSKAGYRPSELILRPSSGVGSSVGLGVGGGGGNVGVGVGLSVPVRLGGGTYPSRIAVEMHPQ